MARRYRHEAKRVSGSTETYGKSATVREHEEKRTLPRRGLFGKDVDKSVRLFKYLGFGTLAAAHPF